MSVFSLNSLVSVIYLLLLDEAFNHIGLLFVILIWLAVDVLHKHTYLVSSRCFTQTHTNQQSSHYILTIVQNVEGGEGGVYTLTIMCIRKLSSLTGLLL